MDLVPNLLKRAIRAGKPQFGVHSRIPSNYCVEIVAGAGFDWVLIDTEHTANDLESVLVQLQVIAAYPTTPIVHVAWNDMVATKRLLDAGAQTLLVPYVSTVEEAKQAVAHVRYPPEGVRGLANVTRASRFGRVKNYVRHAHEEICLLVMLETKQALDNLEAICAVDGIDGVFVGPGDLGASLGYAGERENPELKRLVDDALRRIRRCGKAPGVMAHVEADARRWIECGALLVSVVTDTRLLVRGLDEMAAKFVQRNGVGKSPQA